MKTRTEVIWFWMGGRLEGKWRSAPYSEVVLAGIRRGGRVAVIGTEEMGAPEGPPSEKAFLAVGV